MKHAVHTSIPVDSATVFQCSVLIVCQRRQWAFPDGVMDGEDFTPLGSDLLSVRRQSELMESDYQARYLAIVSSDRALGVCLGVTYGDTHRFRVDRTGA